MAVTNLTQRGRPCYIATPLARDPEREPMVVVGLHGSEAISRPFQFTVELLAAADFTIPFDKLLGEKMVVTLEYAAQDKKTAKRFFNGVCDSIVEGQRDRNFVTFTLRLVPSFALLAHRVCSRIFMGKSVPEILDKVLQGLDVVFELKGRYPKREYCVQYHESDFHFASRLMEEEGIFYFFRHSAQGHKMVVADSAASHEFLEPRELFQVGVEYAHEQPFIRSWAKSQAIRSGKVTVWDNHFQLPYKHLEADKTVQDRTQVGKVSHALSNALSQALEIYCFPGRFAHWFDDVDPGGSYKPGATSALFTENKRVAELRMQQETAQAVQITGTSECRHLCAGYKFEHGGFCDFTEKDCAHKGVYVLTEVIHSFRHAGGIISGGQAPQYNNTFNCIPVSIPFRPPAVTPKPTIQGYQLATVVGPKDEEIFTDRFGRVKVQFHWHREGKQDPGSSCWLRVATLWAGKNWGTVFIPRVGHEVVVGFEEGDPDRPIILGSVYNADNMPPYTLPDNKTQSGIKTRSSLKGSPNNFNELRFEDKKGAEEIVLHAERNLSTSVEADEAHFVGGSRTTVIKKDETVTIEEGDRHVKIQKGDDNLIVSQGKRTVLVSKGDHVLVVEKGDVVIEAQAGQVTIKAAKKITLAVGGATIELSPAAVDINAPTINIKGGMVKINS
ncbi:MAG: type VI secretion system tip protein VgrG [Gemmataceae bacterium]